MRRWILVVGCMVGLGQRETAQPVQAATAAAQSAQEAPVPPFEVYSQRVLNRWQEVNGIVIEAAAQRRILTDVNSQRPRIRAWQRIRPDSAEEQSLLIELQRQYCFDLRDLRSTGRRAGARDRALGIVPVQVNPSKPVITERDVEATPFQKAVDWLMKTVGPREVGYLEILTSNPGALIFFGSDTRPSGYTSRNFVMGVGGYQVRVAPTGLPGCAENLQIRARERATMKCPKPAGAAD